MSDTVYKVPYTKILDIQPHGNADRLSIATVYGFQVIIAKDRYKIGDEIIYVPIDSILPQDLEDILFSPDSKIKLTKHRVRQIKIRGIASQGMIIDVSDIRKVYSGSLKLEENYAGTLRIVKYEPPVPGEPSVANPRKVRKTENPIFHKYNGLNNIKWFPTMFKEDEEVVIQEKLHGSNIRFGLVVTHTNTLWRKLKKFLGLLDPLEKVYGSNNVEISSKLTYSGYYGEDVYGKALDKIKAFEKVKANEIVYGELIGEGVQKNYDYGHKEKHVVIYDVKIHDPSTGSFKWLNPEEVESYAKERGFDHVPVLYVGKFDKDKAYELTKGASIYYPAHKVREGVVIKSRNLYNDLYAHCDRRSLKYVSEDYLNDTSNTDFH